jgi:aryl-alcohol dehydrogenase-like predicted oxidoreductase
MKLALGTVQFGLDYGVANTIGQVDKNEIKKILTFAKQEGIDTLDTAIGYGDSEKYLGHAGIDGWNVITKLPEIKAEHSDIDFWVNSQINNSLLHLNVLSVSGILLHRPLQLLEKNGLRLWSSLEDLKERGIVKKIGFSVYGPDDLDKLWKAGFLPDIVQAPYNIFDQRLKDSGWLSKLNDNKVEVHTRSVFLQGLLLMSSDKRPKYFSKWNNIFDEWDLWLKTNNISGLEVALNFVLSEDLIDKIIVGVDSKIQLSEVISASKNYTLGVPKILNTTDDILINPSLWDM